MKRKIFYLFTLYFTIRLIISIFLFQNGFIYSLDDAYIHMKYAKQFLNQDYFKYSPYASETIATSSPLWTGILIVFIKIFGDKIIIPFIINLLIGVITVLFFYKLVKTVFNDEKAWISSLILCIEPLFMWNLFTGMESTLYVLVFLTIFYYFIKNNYLIITILCGVSFLLRPESIILYLIISGIYLFRKRFEFFKHLPIFLLIISPWIITCLSINGTIFPDTYWAKKAYLKIVLNKNFPVMGSMKLIIPFIVYLIIIGALITILSIILFFKKRKKIFIYFLTIVFFYIILNLNILGHMHRYVIFGPTLLIFLTNYFKKRMNYLLFIFMILFIIPFTLNSFYSIKAIQEQHLNAASIMEGKISIPDIGVIGYYSNTTIVSDTLGIATPEIIPYIEAGTHYAYWSRVRPDYIFDIKGRQDFLINSTMCRLIFEKDMGYASSVLTPFQLFKCNWSSVGESSDDSVNVGDIISESRHNFSNQISIENRIKSEINRSIISGTRKINGEIDTYRLVNGEQSFSTNLSEYNLTVRVDCREPFIINNNSFSPTRGVREISLGIISSEVELVSESCKVYHYWLNRTSTIK